MSSNEMVDGAADASARRAALYKTLTTTNGTVLSHVLLVLLLLAGHGDVNWFGHSVGEMGLVLAFLGGLELSRVSRWLLQRRRAECEKE